MTIESQQFVQESGTWLNQLLDDVMQRPGMYGTLPMAEGYALGIIAAWRTIVSPDPIAMDWKAEWEAVSAEDKKTKGYSMEFDGRMPSNSVAAPVAHRVARLMELTSDSVFCYYRDAGATPRSLDHDRAIRLLSGLWEVLVDKAPSWPANVWTPEALEGLTLSLAFIRESLLTDLAKKPSLMYTCYHLLGSISSGHSAGTLTDLASDELGVADADRAKYPPITLASIAHFRQKLQRLSRLFPR